jgi:hypothetical protein
MIHVFTSAARNYLPKVRVLFSSLKEHHPELVCHFVAADRDYPPIRIEEEPFDDVMTADALGISDFLSWSFRHDIVELSTAIKPFALMRLLEQPGSEGVIYLDPDIVVFSPLTDVLGAFEEASILLTPHQATPDLTERAIVDNEMGSLKFGIFNLGFFGVKNDANGAAFAKWWCDRLYFCCRAELGLGVWTDQKWINHAVVFFDGVRILRSPRLNVAPWNLANRKLVGDLDTGITVDDEPLGFYHFTGFDCGAHHVMADIYSTHSPVVPDLVAWYEGECQRRETKNDRAPVWGFACFDDGTKITPAHRIVYRELRHLHARFPNPFDTSGKKNYRRWFVRHAAKHNPDIVARKSHLRWFSLRKADDAGLLEAVAALFIQRCLADCRLVLRIMRSLVYARYRVAKRQVKVWWRARSRSLVRKKSA